MKKEEYKCLMELIKAQIINFRDEDFSSSSNLTLLQREFEKDFVEDDIQIEDSINRTLQVADKLIEEEKAGSVQNLPDGYAAKLIIKSGGEEGFEHTNENTINKINTIKIDTYKRAGNSAWMPVESVVRATCLESGLYAESFEERSEHRNLIVAKQRLKDLKATLLNAGQEEILIFKDELSS